MNENLLRTFINEMITGLERDDEFIDFLRRGPHGMQNPLRRLDIVGKLGLRINQGSAEVSRVVDDWMEDIEYERGGKISKYNKMVISRYVARKWPELLHRFNDDHFKAKQTLLNILNSKYNYIRIER